MASRSDTGPSRCAVSSVGGWVSTRASEQFSTAYGSVEDLVYSIEAVLPDGELVHLGKAPRAAAGPDLRHVVMELRRARWEWSPA